MIFPKPKPNVKTAVPNAVRQLHRFLASGQSGQLPKKLAQQLDGWMQLIHGKHWNHEICESIGCYIDLTSIHIDVEDAIYSLQAVDLEIPDETPTTLSDLSEIQLSIVVKDWLETHFEDPDQGRVSAYGILKLEISGLPDVYLVIDWSPNEDTSAGTGNVWSAFSSQDQSMAWLRSIAIVDIDWIDTSKKHSEVLRAASEIRKRFK